MKIHGIPKQKQRSCSGNVQKMERSFLLPFLSLHPFFLSPFLSRLPYMAVANEGNDLFYELQRTQKGPEEKNLLLLLLYFLF